MDRLAPNSHLRLEWVYGYRGHQCHNDLFYASTETSDDPTAPNQHANNKIVYFVAGVCIVYDVLQHRQKFFLGHSDDVLCLCQHPSGDLFASGQIGKDPFVCVWDSKDCEVKSLLQNGHQRGISALDFSHDGTLLASVGLDDHHSMCIWDWKKGRIIAQHRTHGDKVLEVKFNPNNNSRLVTCGVKHIKFWTLSGNTLAGKSGVMGTVAPLQTFLTLSFDRYANVLAGTLNGMVYQFEENKLVKAHQLHKGAVFCMSSCVNGYVTGGKDGHVRLLDLNFNVIQQYNLMDTEQGYPGLCVKSVSWKDDRILVGTQNSEVFELSSRSTDKVSLLVQGHSEGELWALATHPTKANYFTTCSDDCSIQQWSITGLCVKSVSWKDDRILVGTQNSEVFELSSRSTDKVSLLVQGHSEGELWALATHPTKANYFTTCSDDCSIQQWSITERGVFSKKILEHKARSIAYSADAAFLAVGFINGSFSVLKTKDLSEIHNDQIRSEVIHELKFSPDGSHLAVGSNDNYVDIFDCLHNWKKVGQCSGNSSFITHIDWSQDGKHLQTNSGAAERLVYKMPSGKRLTSKDEIDKIVWHTWTGVLGQEVAGIWAKYTDTNDVNAIDVNFEQGVCVTGDDFGLVKLFKFPTFKKGAKFKKYTGHSAHVTNVRFTSDRKRVITVGGADHAVFQWRFLIGNEEENETEQVQESESLVNGGAGWSDSEGSDSELSNVGELDSDIEREAEQNYDRFVNKESTQDTFKSANLVTQKGGGLRNGENVAKLKQAPCTGLVLDHVFGYRGYDCRNNVFLMSSGEVVYHVAALGIVLDRKTNVQRFYNGHSDDILCLALHPAKDLAATGQVGKSASVHVWDCVTMKCVSILRGDMSRGVCCVDFSSLDGGKRLVAVSLDEHHTVHVWEWRKGEKLASVRGHKDKILAVKFNPFNTEKLVICGVKHIKFLTQTGGGLTTKRGTFGTVAKLVTMCCVTFGNSEQLCFTGAETGHVYAWKDNVLLRAIEAHTNGPCACIAAVSNYEGFVTGGKDGRACLWNENFDKSLRSYSIEKSDSLKITGKVASIRAVKIGHGVIIAATKNSEVLEIDKSGAVAILVQGHHEGELWGLAVNRNCDHIATVSDDKSLKIWSVKLKKMISSFQLQKGARCLDFSPNGEFIAVGNIDGSFGVYKCPPSEGNDQGEKLEALVEVHHRKEEISDIKFSPDSAKYLAVASHDNFVDVYNVNSEKRVGVCKGASSYITHVDWDSSEKLLMVTSGAKELLFFEAPRGKRISLRNDMVESTPWYSWTCVLGHCVEGIWPPRCDVTDVNACSRFDNLIATGDDFGFVKLFNFPAKGKFAKFKQYAGHSAHVTNVRWIPDGSHLVSVGGADTSVMIWRNKSAITSTDQSAETPRVQSESSKFSIDSGDSDVSFGDSDLEGFDSDVQRECEIDFDAKIYPSSREVLKSKKEKQQDDSKISERSAISRAKPKEHQIVLSNSKKSSKDEIVGLDLEHVIGYRGCDTRNSLHLVNEGKDIVYHAAAVCIVQNLQSGAQQFYMEHTDDVLCLAVCQFPKLKHVCASGQVGLKPAVHVWDHTTLDIIAILNDGHSRGVCMLDFSSSGRYLCTVGLDPDHTLVVWKWQEALQVSKIPTGPNRVFTAQFRPDSDSHFVSVGQKHLTFWTVAGSALLPKRPHIPQNMNHKKQTMLSVAFGIDQLTFTGAMSGDIYVWKRHILSRVVSKAHKGPVFSLFTTLKDGLIVSAGKDKNMKEAPSAVKLWDSELKRCKAFFLENTSKQITVKSCCRTGGLILVGTKNSEVLLIDEKKGSLGKLVDGHSEGELNGLATHPSDPNTFVSASADSSLRIWHMNNLKEPSKVLQLSLSCSCVNFSADGELVAVGFSNGSLKLFTTSTAQLWAQKRDRSAAIQVISFSPDGSKMAVGSEDGSLDLYSLSAGPSLSRLNSVKDIKSAVRMMDFSSDSLLLQVVTGDYDKRVYDVESAVQVDDTEVISNVMWSSWTAIIGKEVSHIWPVENFEAQSASEKRTQGDLINSAHVNPRGVNRIATGDDSGYVKLFSFPATVEDPARGPDEVVVNEVAGHSAHVTAVRFSQNDSHLISAGGEDSCLFVWKCVFK